MAIVKADFMGTRYEETIKKEGFFRNYQVKMFQKEGYKVIRHHFEYFLLVKPAKIIVDIYDPNLEQEKEIDVTKEVLKDFGRKKVNEKVYEKFKEAIEDEKIVFYVKSDPDSIEPASYWYEKQ